MDESKKKRATEGLASSGGEAAASENHRMGKDDSSAQANAVKELENKRLLEVKFPSHPRHCDGAVVEAGETRKIRSTSRGLLFSPCRSGATEYQYENHSKVPSRGDPGLENPPHFDLSPMKPRSLLVAKPIQASTKNGNRTEQGTRYDSVTVGVPLSSKAMVVGQQSKASLNQNNNLPSRSSTGVGRRSGVGNDIQMPVKNNIQTIAPPGPVSRVTSDVLSMPPLLRWGSSLASIMGPVGSPNYLDPREERVTRQPRQADDLIKSPQIQSNDSGNYRWGLGIQNDGTTIPRTTSGSTEGNSEIDGTFLQCVDFAIRANSMATSSRSGDQTIADENIAIDALVNLSPLIQKQSNRIPPSSEFNHPPLLTPPVSQFYAPAVANIDRLLESHPHLFANVQLSIKPCKCKPKTQCLKLYCSCFQGGLLCNPRICKCLECKNNAENNGRTGIRAEAIAVMLRRRADAFDPRPRQRRIGSCACKSSR